LVPRLTASIVAAQMPCATRNEKAGTVTGLRVAG
jgi:hypothetical protein